MDIYHVLSNYSQLKDVCWLQFLAIRNNAAMNICMQVFLWTQFFISLGVELLNCM